LKTLNFFAPGKSNKIKDLQNRDFAVFGILEHYKKAMFLDATSSL